MNDDGYFPTTRPLVDLDEAYRSAVRRARRVLGADAAMVVRGRAPEHRVVAADSRPGFDVDGAVSASQIEQVARTGRAAWGESTHPKLIVPIIERGEVRAALQVVRQTTNTFTDEEIEAIEALARDLAELATGVTDDEPTPDPTRLRRSAISELLGLRGAAPAASTGDEHDPLVDSDAEEAIVFSALLASEDAQARTAELLSNVLASTGGHVAAIARYTSDVEVLALAATREAPDVPAQLLISRTIVRQVTDTALPTLSLQADEDDDVSASSLFDMGVASVMCIPLVGLDARAFAVLYTASFSRAGRFDPTSLTDIMAEARASVRLLEKLLV